MSNDIVLVLVVITALAVDFTNGFHDTGTDLGGWRVIRTLGKRTTFTREARARPW